MQVSGVINLFKPPGVSSARYVYRLRPIFGLRRVGHAGALDPFADGVLLGCVGQATRLVERLMGLDKEYEVTLRLGVTNATFDPEQPFQAVPDAAPPALDAVIAALNEFTGTIAQVPPAYSAVKIDGRPAHQRTRDGQAVTLEARPVRIDMMELRSFEWPAMRLRVVCGRGTYIRALARDLGKRWGCGAVCEVLRRTRVGPFDIHDAVNLDIADASTVRAALRNAAAVEALIRRDA